MLWDSRDNGCQRRLGAQPVLFRYLTPQLIEIDILLRPRGVSLGLKFLDKRVCNIRTGSHIPFILGGKLCVFLGFVQLRGGQRSQGLRCHDGARIYFTASAIGRISEEAQIQESPVLSGC